MASALGEADEVINNAQSEGLANALLEAATLGVPILARNNPGNAAVVHHRVNGLLYDDDRECARLAGRLLDQELRRQLSRPDPSYHPDREARALAALLLEAAGDTGRKGRKSRHAVERGQRKA
jgi:glycosyltransferase involved in cell wall biosynthesis